jgi:hypothetical protein
MAAPVPEITRVDGRPRLLVDGRPFLILGLQWDCDSCFCLEEMAPLFPHAVRMGANTAVLPTYWREVEPERGRFDFTMVDHRIRLAREHSMRLVLLWFATWKNGAPCYAPQYVRDDPVTYPRALGPDGRSTVSPCPSSQVTWQRDRDALVALMAHLRETDDARTVIMVQLENEPGIIGSDRCYCADCSARFEAEDWAGRYGDSAAEAFSVSGIAGYIDRLAAEARAAYALPLCVNVWLAPDEDPVPGRYPSGGAVQHMLGLFRQLAPHIDLIAPDTYATGCEPFDAVCRTYARPDNPLYIAEHGSSLAARPELNVFYAIGRHGSLGFDPWAIDACFPEPWDPPLVAPVGGEWSPVAHMLRDSYVPIGRAVEAIVDAQGTDRIFTFVQESEDAGPLAWEVSDRLTVTVRFRDRGHKGRGMAIRLADDEILVLGVGFVAAFRHPGAEHQPVPVRLVEWGLYDRDRWVCRHPIRRERLRRLGQAVAFLEPGAARVWLDFGG